MNQNRLNFFRTILTVVAIILAVYLGFKLGKNQATLQSRSIEVRTPISKLDNILRLIATKYIDSVSISDIIESSIPMIVEHLDPHSTYIPAQDFAEINEPLQGNFEGIGITFNMTNDTIIVINTISGGPSSRVGIEAGDRILRINDSLVAGRKIDSDSIVKKLKGPSGSKVSLDIQRQGFDKEIPFTITRAKIPIKSIDVAYMVNEDIGFIKISKFSRTTYEEFIAAINKLKKQGMKKIILDLRDNTGGYLDQVIGIINEFFSEKVLIVYTEGYNSKRDNAYSRGKGRCADIPIMVLINESSASASEILAGAIQDNDRGEIVGRRSFGKGLVQEPITFSDGSGLNLTVSRYYTPTGRCIQKPYDKGLKKYYHELYDRLLNNEFFERDSIHFNDSLKYTTPKGKIVYGGGGIMPDIFVPLDTIGNSNQFFRLIAQKNLAYNFVLNYTDMNREKINGITDFKELDDFLKTQNIFDKFLTYAARNGVNVKSNELAEAKQILEPQLLALIGRNTPLDDEGFYPYYQRIDLTLQVAIDTMANIK